MTTNFILPSTTQFFTSYREVRLLINKDRSNLIPEAPKEVLGYLWSPHALQSPTRKVAKIISVFQKFAASKDLQLLHRKITADLLPLKGSLINECLPKNFICRRYLFGYYTWTLAIVE
eukprot:GHVP01017726.1.p1 GENE.GHVP01017726.1~~GHVP01017726.1.p1  ORF type:complete len:118 (+),score=2.12 GHVP01017726.1:389-742(+)